MPGRYAGVDRWAASVAVLSSLSLVGKSLRRKGSQATACELRSLERFVGGKELNEKTNCSI
jgi:hypothetical protein